MNAPFKQDARMGRLATILGKDVLNLQTFRGEEHVNGLFTYRIEALSDDGNVNFDDLIGTNATVHLTSFDLPEVPFDGLITEAELIGEGDRGWRYAFTLRPWLWLLGLRRKQQIYHDKTVVEILSEVFAPYGRDVTNRLTGDYPTLEYTVQYRETDLAFACRMMERFGISYHFAHDDGAHALVLTDNITAHEDLPGSSRAFITAKDHRATTEHFWDMRPTNRLTTGRIRLTDYNFKAPDAAMETDRTGGAPYAEGEIESYDYPGDYPDQGAGKKVARLRVDQERGQDPRHRGTGDCASLRAGLRVKVAGETVPGVGAALCLGARHSYTAGGYGSDGGSGEPAYEGQYLLMPADTPLRPERKTPRAVVQGPQTARVVGEGEIDCDEYGRILVRFHWDLENRYSMRCRVSQTWAGKGWGGMVIPRIGMEVVVEFLEGDPDKPLVTGCVYNGKNEVPYPLPKHKTRSTFKTDTHQGTGYNELRFEDKKDAEEIYVHAEKDMNIDVGDTHTKHVVNNDLEMVENNKVIEVNRNHSEVVGGSMSVHVGPTHIGRFISQGLFNLVEKLGGYSKKFGVPGALDPTAGNYSITVEKHALEAVGLTSVHTVGLNDSLFVGKTAKINAGKEIKMAAGELVRITCGKSKIEMKDNGEITLNGDKININAATLVKINGKTVDIN